MAYNCDAFIETIERLLINYRKTGKRQDMELWLMAYHRLTR